MARTAFDNQPTSSSRMANKAAKYHFQIFARNFRGFARLEAELGDVTFIVGDNSSGKTSIVSLVDLLLNRSFAMNFDILSADAKLRTSNDILSPYIKSPRVTVGMMLSKSTEKKNEFSTNGRMAMYEKEDEKLVLKKIASASENKVRYIINKSDGPVSKDLTLNEGRPMFSNFLQEIDHPSKGYSKIKIPGLKNIPSLMMFALAEYNQKEKSFNFKFSNTEIGHRIFGPIRMDPEHAYNALASAFDEKGKHTPNLLKQLFSDRKNLKKSIPHIRAINKFGVQSGMFDRLFVSSYKSSDPKAPFKIEVEKKGKRFSLDEVGYGVSQILPIIVDAITRGGTQPALLSIQQPELHLHPRAQAAFGELVFDLARENIKFLIETHSDYTINRFRYCVHKKKKELISKIFFCENTAKGNVLSVINIDGDGAIVDAPQGYRKFFLDEENKNFEMV